MIEIKVNIGKVFTLRGQRYRFNKDADGLIILEEESREVPNTWSKHFDFSRVSMNEILFDIQEKIKVVE